MYFIRPMYVLVYVTSEMTGITSRSVILIHASKLFIRNSARLHILNVNVMLNIDY